MDYPWYEHPKSDTVLMLLPKHTPTRKQKQQTRLTVWLPRFDSFVGSSVS